MSTRTGPAPIGDLPAIGRPAESALTKAGIRSLAQVAVCSRSQLLAMHGVGPKAVRILEAALEAQGLRFAD
jgi:predicted flap endonuclease-1-like 5' DNA nuclease